MSVGTFVPQCSYLLTNEIIIKDWPPLKKTKADYCMQYDYNFVNTYCYSQMNDYKVNSTTGQIRDNPTVGVRFHDHKTYLQILKTKFEPNQDLSYMKNYPYNLLFLALLGLILNILWEITAVRRSTMVIFTIKHSQNFFSWKLFN